jgi:hypothetical protein
MTQEDKDLLLKDLCARLPYWTKVLTEDNDKGYIIGADDTENGVFEIHIIEDGDSYTCDESIENFKPYLRPMSSMTEEEYNEYGKETDLDVKDSSETLKENLKAKSRARISKWYHGVDWLDAHHFDYRGLIEKGLALEAPEDMYKTK